MIVTAYIFTWNEEDLIALAIRHYRRIADRIVIMDNHSDDRTPGIASAMGCEIRTWGRPGVFDDGDLISAKSTCWRADRFSSEFHIVVDCDEILNITREQLKSELLAGTTLIPTYGYNMHASGMPAEDLMEIDMATFAPGYSKTVCFRGGYLYDIGYSEGAHKCRPRGDVRWGKKRYELRHYKFIGGAERHVMRYGLVSARSSARNKSRGFSYHYHYPADRIRQEFESGLSAAKPISSLGAYPASEFITT